MFTVHMKPKERFFIDIYKILPEMSYKPVFIDFFFWGGGDHLVICNCFSFFMALLDTTVEE